MRAPRTRGLRQRIAARVIDPITRAVIVLLVAASSADPSDTRMPDQSVRLTVDAPRAIRVGDSLRLDVALVNDAPTPQTLYARGRTLAWDVELLEPDGTRVWHHLDGAIVPAIIQVVTLGPGEARRERLVIPLDARAQGPDANARASARGVIAGDYGLVVVLLTDAEPLRSEVRPLRVQP